jgi:hypothetical protein
MPILNEENNVRLQVYEKIWRRGGESNPRIQVLQPFTFHSKGSIQTQQNTDSHVSERFAYCRSGPTTGQQSLGGMA